MDNKNVTTHGIFSATKKTEIMRLSGKWIELENMLSEVTQAQKDKCCMYLPSGI